MVGLTLTLVVPSLRDLRSGVPRALLPAATPLSDSEEERPPPTWVSCRLQRLVHTKALRDNNKRKKCFEALHITLQAQWLMGKDGSKPEPPGKRLPETLGLPAPAPVPLSPQLGGDLSLHNVRQVCQVLLCGQTSVFLNISFLGPWLGTAV